MVLSSDHNGKYTALIYRKSFLCTVKPAGTSSPLTLEKKANTVLSAVLQTAAGTRSHNLQGTFVVLYCYLLAIAEVISETLPKAGELQK